MLWAIASDLGVTPKGGPEVCHHNFDPLRRIWHLHFNSLTTCSRSQSLDGSTDQREPHTLDLYVDQSRGLTFQSINCGQCCLTFVVLMGTKASWLAQYGTRTNEEQPTALLNYDIRRIRIEVSPPTF